MFFMSGHLPLVTFSLILSAVRLGIYLCGESLRYQKQKISFLRVFALGKLFLLENLPFDRSDYKTYEEIMKFRFSFVILLVKFCCLRK